MRSGTLISGDLLRRLIDFTQDHAVLILVEQRAKLLDPVEELGLVLMIDLAQLVIGFQVLGVVQVARVVPQLLILDQVRQGIDPQPIDPAPQPKMHRFGDRLPDLGVTPVQIGLLGSEGTEVILAGRFVQRPSAFAKPIDPVVRRAATDAWIAPQIPWPLGVVARLPRLHKPGMLDRSVVGDKVDDDPQPPPVSLGDQPIKIRERPKPRVDGGVVRDVVTDVVQR